ncbi:MAG: nitrilase-related carbon-nitrogen hydrolase, partial [Gammaproteobacteria bacterium]
MNTNNRPVQQYMALALQPMMVGAETRADITRNLDHIAELAFAAKNVTEIEMPVRLYTVPEGALQGFTDEIFDWEHTEYVERMAIEIPGPETGYLGELARGLN